MTTSEDESLFSSTTTGFPYLSRRKRTIRPAAPAWYSCALLRVERHHALLQLREIVRENLAQSRFAEWGAPFRPGFRRGFVVAILLFRQLGHCLPSLASTVHCL